MRPSFWTILIAIIIVIAISIGLMTNPLNNTEKGKAEEFLKLYYTIENTDIADMFYDENLKDDSKLNFDGTGITSIKGLDEALSAKYGSLMTEDAFNRASANRTLLIGEVTAREYGTRITIEGVNLWDEEVSENGDVTYQFSIPARVKFKDGTEELINLNGTLVMKKLDNDWKVSDFQINRTELAKVLEHGKSILSITNQSHGPIRRIEVDTEGNSQGAMNADNTIMEMNSRFDFEMIDAKNIFFNVKLLNVDNELLFEQAFSGDFSKGKDVYLYIVNYGDNKLMIVEGNSEGNNIHNSVSASEFFDKLVMINNKTYVDTGYEISEEISRSDIIGKISSAVKSHETPIENGQANFDIKGASIAQYKDDIVVFMDKKWILFKNQDDMPSGFSVNNFGFLMEEYSDEEIFQVFRTIRKYIIIDENYRDNLLSIIEKSFKENGIDDPAVIEKAKTDLQIEVKYTEIR